MNAAQRAAIDAAGVTRPHADDEIEQHDGRGAEAHHQHARHPERSVRETENVKQQKKERWMDIDGAQDLEHVLDRKRAPLERDAFVGVQGPAQRIDRSHCECQAGDSEQAPRAELCPAPL